MEKTIKQQIMDYETIGRDKFINKVKNTDYKIIPQDVKSVFDILLINNKSKRIKIVECKHRTDNYYNYKDMLLERDKYESLQKVRNEYLDEYPDYTVDILYTHSFSGYDKVKVVKLDSSSVPDFHLKELQRSHVTYTGMKMKSISYITSYKMYRYKKDSLDNLLKMN